MQSVAGREVESAIFRNRSFIKKQNR